MPGCRLLSLSEARPDPRFSKQGVEIILQISGEDDVGINPKHAKQYTCTLVCKVLVVSNEIPEFDDPTGAMEARMLPWQTTVPHIHDADTGLQKALEAEQNEIAWWALRGLRREALLSPQAPALGSGPPVLLTGEPTPV